MKFCVKRLKDTLIEVKRNMDMLLEANDAPQNESMGL